MGNILRDMVDLVAFSLKAGAALLAIIALVVVVVAFGAALLTFLV